MKRTRFVFIYCFHILLNNDVKLTLLRVDFIEIYICTPLRLTLKTRSLVYFKKKILSHINFSHRWLYRLPGPTYITDAMVKTSDNYCFNYIRQITQKHTFFLITTESFLSSTSPKIKNFSEKCVSVAPDNKNGSKMNFE